MRSRWACATSTAETSFAARRRPSSAAVVLVRSVMAQASSSRMRGTRKKRGSPEPCGRVVGRVGCAGQRVGAGQPGHHDVVAQHVGQRHRVRGRRDVGRGHLTDPGHRLQDHVELAGEAVELLVGDGEPRQAGEVGDLLAARCAAMTAVTPSQRYDEIDAGATPAAVTSPAPSLESPPGACARYSRSRPSRGLGVPAQTRVRGPTESCPQGGGHGASGSGLAARRYLGQPASRAASAGIGRAKYQPCATSHPPAASMPPGACRPLRPRRPPAGPAPGPGR